MPWRGKVGREELTELALEVRDLAAKLDPGRAAVLDESASAKRARSGGRGDLYLQILFEKRRHPGSFNIAVEASVTATTG